MDDNNVVMEELPPGTRLVEGKFLVETDSLVKDDKRAASLLCIYGVPTLQMEVHYPAKNPSSCMPMLNLEVNYKWCKTRPW